MADRHLIYHWKHGWIPLTHAAALSKAHGSASGADRYVPATSAHHGGTKLATRGMSARAIHEHLEPHGSTPRAHTPADQVAKLRPGDHATVTGMDQFGRTITFTGRVQSTPTIVRIKQGHAGDVKHHYAVQMESADGRSRTTVYVDTGHNESQPEPAGKTSPPSTTPPSAGSAGGGSAATPTREHFRMSGPELRERAAKGDRGAQAEIDRRAAKRGKTPSGKKPGTAAKKPDTPAKQAPPAASPASPPASPRPAAPPAPTSSGAQARDAIAQRQARWDAENKRIEPLLPAGHTIESREYVLGRGIHTQRDGRGDRVGYVAESRDGSFAATHTGDGKHTVVGSFATRAQAHQELAKAHAADLEKVRAKAEKNAAMRDRLSRETAALTSNWQAHTVTSDGTRAGNAAAAKIKQAFKFNNHVMHIEHTMTPAQTKTLLENIHAVLLKTDLASDPKGIRFSVPTGDPEFRTKRDGGVTGAYVRWGDRTVHVNPKIADGTIAAAFGRGGKAHGDHLMEAANGTNGQQYVLAHEIGHVLDEEHQHAREQTPGVSRPSVRETAAGQRLHGKHRSDPASDLSRYGRRNIAEAYAEAYAQWIHGGPGSSIVADEYAAEFGWVIPKPFRHGRSP